MSKTCIQETEFPIGASMLDLYFAIISFFLNEPSTHPSKVPRQ